jgi:hypothetical protein
MTWVGVEDRMRCGNPPPPLRGWVGVGGSVAVANRARTSTKHGGVDANARLDHRKNSSSAALRLLIASFRRTTQSVEERHSHGGTWERARWLGLAMTISHRATRPCSIRLPPTQPSPARGEGFKRAPVVNNSHVGSVPEAGRFTCRALTAGDSIRARWQR